MAEPLIERAELRVSRLAADAQLLLHGAPGDAARLSELGGIALCERMLGVRATGDWNALHLSPDEWLLIGPSDDRDNVAARFAGASIPLSLVDISERSLGVEVGGRASSKLLNTGCPLDFYDDAFPAGSCTRTLFGKAPVMIWRPPTADHYRMHYGRSFDDYVTANIMTAAHDVPSPLVKS